MLNALPLNHPANSKLPPWMPLYAASVSLRVHNETAACCSASRLKEELVCLSH